MLLPNNLISEKENQKESTLSKSQKRWMNALFFSAVVGTFTGLVGLIVNALSLFGFLKDDRKLTNLGIWLIIVTFPLAIFTAHCLEKIEKAGKYLRLEHCKKQGMRDEECR